uniref:Uncharacterized protein n=1 Tax=Hucho hucho TaxID=62062 RepID=A0A4W5R4B0_9TELE
MSKPNYTETFYMVSHFENYRAASVKIILIVICCLRYTTSILEWQGVMLKPDSMKIRTLTTFKDSDMDFKLGQVCTTVDWEGDKLVCEKGRRREEDGHWLEGDKLHLVRMEGGMD